MDSVEQVVAGCWGSIWVPGYSAQDWVRFDLESVVANALSAVAQRNQGVHPSFLANNTY